MKQFEMREFVGSDGIVYEARDTTSAGHARELDLSLFQVLNDTPAWLTASERLLLFTLIYSLRPSRYLEIGVLYGGASLIVSKAMDAAGYDGRLTLIDPEPQIDPVHWDQMSGRSVLLEGRSPGAIPEARRAAGGPFDFVFIDAGHSTEAVTRDAEGVLPHVQDGAYLLFHDSYRAEIAEAIDRFTRIHLGSIVDFGTLTREFHSPEHRPRRRRRTFLLRNASPPGAAASRTGPAHEPVARSWGLVGPKAPRDSAGPSSGLRDEGLIMAAASPSDYQRLLRFGQMYVGPRIPSILSDWRTVSIGGSLRLAAHPALNVIQIERHPYSLTLVGYLIDPEHPDRDDRQILASLMDTPGFPDAPFGPTDRLGGRWLLVLDGPTDTFAFSDPGGLRQFYYARETGGGAVHGASEPGILGEALGFALDGESESFRASPGFERNEEYWWPGDASPFAEVKRLLPSFFVSLRTGRSERYWPASPLTESDPETTLRLLAGRLPAMMRAIARRGDVAVTITAGLDSRMVLAACRDIVDELHFVTVQQAGMPSTHADLDVPRRLASQMGFEHRIVSSAERVRDGVRAGFRDGVLFFHEKWLRDAQGILDAYDQRMISVVGSMGEVGRLFYGDPLPGGRPVTTDGLIRAGKLGDHPFARHHFQRWLESLERPMGYNAADLFYIEQRAGRWMASSQLEFGHVWRDVFAPFNSREVLTALLAVPEAARRPPRNRLFTDLIARLWPEVLSEPINPHMVRSPSGPLRRFTKSLKRRFRRYLG
jgi:predicted O-methyltransferase YrrM